MEKCKRSRSPTSSGKFVRPSQRLIRPICSASLSREPSLQKPLTQTVPHAPGPGPLPPLQMEFHPPSPLCSFCAGNLPSSTIHSFSSGYFPSTCHAWCRLLETRGRQHGMALPVWVCHVTVLRSHMILRAQPGELSQRSLRCVWDRHPALVCEGREGVLQAGCFC